MDRIEKLRHRYLRKPRLSIERARLYTESMKQTEGNPMILRQAKALKHVLENIPIQILPDELLVGVMAPDPPVAIMYPEGVGLRILNELDSLPSRATNPLELLEEDARIVREEIAPYWFSRSLGAVAAEIAPKRSIDLLLRGAYFIATEIAGISHVSVNYPFLLSKGLKWIKDFADRKVEDYESLKTIEENVEKILFYKAVSIVCEAVINFANRYSKLAEEIAWREEGERREELLKISEICKKVPVYPPESFWEALQFIWFMQLALHQENYEQGISMGRIDEYLYPYFLKDVREGKLSYEKAVELISCLWLKTNEIVPLFDELLTTYFAGMPTNQAVTIGAGNEVTYLMLEATRKVALRQPNVHVRLKVDSSEKLWDECLDIVASGLNNIALFNEKVIVETLLTLGVSYEDALNYTTIGCVELAPGFGKSFTSSDAALFNIAACVELALNNGYHLGELVGVETIYSSFDEFINVFRRQVEHMVKHMVATCNAFEVANQIAKPTPLLSICIEGPLEEGRDITLGSAKINFTGVQCVGLADAADSLAALEIAFKEGFIEELKEALKNDFEGYEWLRKKLLNAPKYGCDCSKYAELVAKIYAEEVLKHRNVRNGKFIPGAYSMSTHVGFGMLTGSLPSGRRRGEALSNGISPAVVKSLTAAMKDVAKVCKFFPNGVSYTVTLAPQIAESKEKFKALLKAFFELGGMHVHFNVVDVEKLKEAQRNPEKYRDLLVRVAGFSAYFVDLTNEVQEEIIKRYQEWA